jgi:N-acyl-D-amino-acid deacylase
MTHFDMLIRGGTIVDGSGSARFQGDVGITDGVITAIGPSVDGEADEVMDATGLIVAPGVLDRELWVWLRAGASRVPGAAHAYDGDS